MTTNPWPALPLAEWKDTYVTLHMWTQIVGKIRLALTPLVNHWWNTTLYVTPRGLTTIAMPYNSRQLQIDFDFIDHRLLIETTDASAKTVALQPCSVAEFYQETMAALGSLDMPVTIWTTPVEVQIEPHSRRIRNMRLMILSILSESGEFCAGHRVLRSFVPDSQVR